MGALPLPGGELRRDRVWRAGAGLSLPLSTERAGKPAFALELGYDFTGHSSNDAFYDYRSHGGGIALSIAY